jgi:hypothetical protein
LTYTQSGRPSTIARIRFFDFSGTQRVSSMARSAQSRRPSPRPGGSGLSGGPAIGMNHCWVQRKMIFALERQLCG